MKTLKPAELYTHTHTHTRIILSGIIFALCITGNAWAGTAKYKGYPIENSVEFLIFDLPSGNLDNVSYPNGISVLNIPESPQKYGILNFKYLDYFKCDNGTIYYQKDVNTANALFVAFNDNDEEGCYVRLVCDGSKYYVDNPTWTTKDKCIKQNTVLVVDKATQNPLRGVELQASSFSTNLDGKTLSQCDRGKDDVCVELAGYKKQCQICKENMVFELEKIVKKPKKTEKTKEKESDEKPVTPPAETDDATDEDNEKKTNPSGEDVGEDANETPVATENENGAAATDDDDAPTKSADDKSAKNEKQNFDFKELDAILDKYFSDSYNWKNEDGNFNTARLVSDSVAGVVLGTAGGVITSKIIKKNQIKKGFEDLKCTVGGQEVATYGDEFTVGAKQ